jgi:tol-pal system protein YbgF
MQFTQLIKDRNLGNLRKNNILTDSKRATEGRTKSVLGFALVAMLIIFSGCSNQTEQRMRDLEDQVRELQRANARTSAHLEELEKINHVLYLVQNRVEKNSLAISELNTGGRTPRIAARPVAPRQAVPPPPVATQAPGAPPVGAIGSAPVVAQSAAAPTVANEVAARDIDPRTDPTVFYRQAYQIFAQGQFQGAIADFTAFIRAWPDHELADNCQYWIGESYYSTKNYQHALIEFKKVVDNYPRENKAPDALLKVGFCQLELNNCRAAREAFARMASQYSGSPLAAKASEKLQSLTAENCRQ